MTAQKEYIITEETRREIIDRLSKPFSEETRKEIERIKRMHDELLPVEMSRVYSSAKSDAVLGDVKQEWRKYILSFKDEDPLFMAFSDGYDYCKKIREQQKGA
jgi:hypothetical protein